MTPRTCLMLISFCLVASAGLGDDWPQWRGPNRDGISVEKGLLKSWPAAGPARLWQVETSGDGYSSPVVVGDVVYVTGSVEEGSGRTGYLQALRAADGSPLWNTPFGPEWKASYAMARSTPTVVGNRIYAISSMGTVSCIGTDGRPVWSVDTAERFKGRNIKWGIAESPLVFDGMVVCHPGGPGAAVAALDAATGATRWTTRELDDESAYCSPLLTTLGGRKTVVTQTAKSVVGIDAASGRVLWQHGHVNKYAVHPNVPLPLGRDRVLVASGYGYGAEALAVGGGQVRRLWLEKKYENHFQGLILRDGTVYGCAGGGLFAFNPDDGSEIAQAPQVGKAQITGCEAGFVTYSGNGQVRLVRAGPGGFEVAGEFRVDYGRGEHWSTPTVANGRLYVRHGRALAAYDVRAPAAAAQR